MSKTIIFDTETTGLKEPAIVEAAWIEIVSLVPFTLTNTWVQRFNPGKPSSIGALATHHILEEELVDCPPSNSFALPDDTEYIIGHNVDFDWQAIGSPDVKRICTLALARKLWPDLDSHNQSSLLYFLERRSAKERLKNAHSALPDVWVCSTIVQRISEKLGVKTFEDFWVESEKARIPTMMAFGKHKGMLIADVSSSYKQWLLAQADVDPYLRKALEA